MLDHQFEESFSLNACRTPSVVALWFFPTSVKPLPITKEEEELSKDFSTKRTREYRLSRGLARLSLSHLLNIDPLKIPIISKPGTAPYLTDDLGFLSISHCSDAIIIGWSKSKIGVDIERRDRSISATSIAKRYSINNNTSKYQPTNISGDDSSLSILKEWVAREAAIKWQRGSINKDMREWKHVSEEGISTHTALNLSVKTKQINFYSWEIGIACDSISQEYLPMICTEKSISFLNVSH